MGTTETGERESIDWPLVVPGALERREYQVTLAEQALDGHSLVCLPTGLGKTTVSLLVTASRLQEAGGTSLLLAPTKPLVAQHADFYRSALDIPDEEIVVFTGEVRPDDRADLWADARVVLATPQVVENDLVGNRISLSSVTHCTFDECHRATGEYAYNYIAERYHGDATDPLVTGMSASPGDDEEAILAVCENLGIENVEVMTEDDADVARYTHETSVEWKRIDLPETVEEIRDAITGVVEDRMARLKELGVTRTTQADVSEREIQKIQGKVQELMNADRSEGYEGMSLLAEVRKLRTALTYVETQSVESFRRYMNRQREAARSSGASKADQRMVSEPAVREAVRTAEAYDDLHPKFRRARMLIAETLGIAGGDRIIVFTESRDTAETLTDFLSEHFAVERFVGQSDTDGSDGMTQTQQQDTLERFRDGEFDVLVSTSVAEEGLDVPEVDLVLFYEPVPTAIRSIQRKGRTGRQTEGRVVVLLAEDTRDEAYFWKARQDEKQMEQELRLLRDAVGEIESALHRQGTLDDLAANGDVDDRAANGDADDRAANGDADDRAANGDADDRAAADGADEATGDGDDRVAADGENGATTGSENGATTDPEDGATSDSEGGVTTDPEDGAATSATEGEASQEEPAGSDGQAGLDAFTDRSGDPTTQDSPEQPATPGDDESGSETGRGETGAEATNLEETGAEETDPEQGETVVAAAESEDDAEVVIDQRELDAAIARDLSTREGIETRLETLAVGDYICSDRVVVERKTVEDFLSTLTGGDRSLFEQVGDAARHYSRPVVVIEGEGLYSRRNIPPRAIHGALASLAVDFGASVMQTGDEEETADLLDVLATREQEDGRREVSVHGEKQSRTLAEQQEYVVSSIAEIGPVTARSLLAEFGSVEDVMTASDEELREAEGVGEVTAARVREVVSSPYSDS